MLIGSNARSFHKKGRLKRQDDELAALRQLNLTYKQQLDGLLTVNREMVAKLAGMGIVVKVGRAGVKFEAAT